MPTDLVATLRASAQRLFDERSIRDLGRTVSAIVAAAVTTVAADGGGISRTERDQVTSDHTTADWIHELDALQSRLGEGPCITAADDPPRDGVVLAADLAGPDAPRWPRFAPQAVEAGYRTVLSVQMSSPHGEPRSALNLYARRPDAFTDDHLTAVGLFGLQAAMLLHGAQHAANLATAISTRDEIGQAKGILIERFGVTGDGAFQMLVESSQQANMKLVDVARWLVADTLENQQA